MSQLSRQLLHAAERANLDQVKQCIASGANVDATAYHLGPTPLYLASENGHLDVVEFLINKGADVNIKNTVGQTPLSCSSAKGYVDVVELLVSKGADLNVQDTHGWTPLYLASHYGHRDVVEFLANKGVDINLENNIGSTPLYSAFMRGRFDIVELLISKGADVNVEDENGWTPLHYASKKSRHDMVKILIHGGADVNHPDKNQQTPLFHAANIVIASLLLAHNADPFVIDKNSQTVHDVIESPTVKKFLLSRLFNGTDDLMKQGNTVTWRDEVTKLHHDNNLLRQDMTDLLQLVRSLEATCQDLTDQNAELRRRVKQTP